MFRQRTFVGLDVQARSAVGHAMDEHTGEVWQQLLPADPPGIWGWLESFPQPGAWTLLPPTAAEPFDDHSTQEPRKLAQGG